MNCPICATEISNTATSCPVCGRIMAVEQPTDSATAVESTTSTTSTTSTVSTASADSTVFSIDGAFEPVPAEILHSDILKSMMKYNVQPKAEEEAPQIKEEAAAPVQEQQVEAPAPKSYSMRTESQPKVSAPVQPVKETETQEQKKKTPIIMKLGQFVKFRHA